MIARPIYAQLPEDEEFDSYWDNLASPFLRPFDYSSQPTAEECKAHELYIWGSFLECSVCRGRKALGVLQSNTVRARYDGVVSFGFMSQRLGEDDLVWVGDTAYHQVVDSRVVCNECQTPLEWLRATQCEWEEDPDTLVVTGPVSFIEIEEQQ